MAEAIALKKFQCPACGSDAHWNPAKQALVCAHCGTTSPVEHPNAEAGVRERDLAEALRDYSETRRGWKTEKIQVRCQNCQAISVFEPGRVAQRCDFCGAAALIPYEQTEAPIHPECLLPFKVTESQVRESVRQWYRTRWFAPNRMKTGALTDTIKGIYLPYWTFDAQADSQWTAESGYYYYTTETYTDSQGKSQTRQVRHTRWVPSSGSLSHFFDDDLIPASVGVREELLRKIEPFPTKELTAYDPGYVAGWVVEQYQIDLVAAATKSRARMDQELARMCAAQVPGDTFRGLQVHTRYSAQTFKHILAPVWLLSFTYGRNSYQVVVNGFTGEIAGKHPLSAIKILLTILVVLLAAGIAWLVFGQR